MAESSSVYLSQLFLPPALTVSSLSRMARQHKTIAKEFCCCFCCCCCSSTSFHRVNSVISPQTHNVDNWSLSIVQWSRIPARAMMPELKLSSTTYCISLGKLLNLSINIWNGDENISFLSGSLWGLNKMMHIKYLVTGK